MKKILMLTFEFPPIIGGIGRYASQLALAAKEIGHDITVIAPQPGAGLSESDKETYPFKVIRYRIAAHSVKKYLSLLWRTWHLAVSSKYDIIHAIDWPHILALGLLNKFKDMSFVATIFGTEIPWVLESKQVKHRLIKSLFETPQHIFAISEFTKSCLLECRPKIPPENVTVTLLGVHPTLFDAPHDGPDIREIYSIPDEHKIILTVSRLDERKGHKTVLRALPKLPVEVRQKVTYLIVGSGVSDSYEAELRQLADESGIRVIFAGKVSDECLKSHYSGSTVFCMPGELHSNTIEGFGLVYLEAAAHGVPSIASRIGGVPEAVLHEKTGLIIESKDELGLAQALTRLLTDESYCRVLGEAAREYAKTFTWRRCAEQTYGPVNNYENFDI